MNIPYSWVSRAVDLLIREESSKLKQARETVSEKHGLSNSTIVREDLDCVAMPEILSAQYCTLSGNTHLLSISPPLQAFLAYAIFLHDIVSDHHLYKDGKPTFLKMYGREAVLVAKWLYEKAMKGLSEELEKEISGATKITEEMYYGTIRWDNIRNSKIVTPHQAIILQNKLAGRHAYNVAVLSNAEEFGIFSSHLVNAITTLEDLIDLFHGEDFTGRKTTIPISFLVNEFGCSIQDLGIIKKSSAVKMTKGYILKNIKSSRRILHRHSSKKEGLLLKIIKDIEDFTTRFPEEYI